MTEREKGKEKKYDQTCHDTRGVAKRATIPYSPPLQRLSVLRFFNFKIVNVLSGLHNLMGKLFSEELSANPLYPEIPICR